MFDQSGLENTFIVFVYSYFTHPLDSWNIATLTQFMYPPRTDQALTCASYIIPYYLQFLCDIQVCDLQM